jgi:outer membrane receptor protein involved in Fe transport
MGIRSGVWVVLALGLVATGRGQPIPYVTTQPITTVTTEPSTEPAAAPEPTTQPSAQTIGAAESTEPVGGTTSELQKVVVRANLDQSRDQIAPSLGAVTYTVGPEQIKAIPEAEDAPFQQVLVRMPGVVMDSFGQYHVRGEHNDLTYRVNGVILPEPLNGFGQELDTRLVDTVTLIDGTLPAQFGFRTAAIVDVTTKKGQDLQGGELSIYGGGYNTLESSLDYGNTWGKWDYFVTTSYRQDSLGIENPTPDRKAIHDDTDQTRFFGYADYNIDDTSRFSFILNTSYADFEIPNVPNLPQLFSLAGVPTANSANTDENQNEQQYYGVVAYQKSTDQFSLQASVYSSYGQIHFTPDGTNDLIFQGVAGEVFNSFLVNGVQVDSSYILNDQHTLRAGFIADYTVERLSTDSGVFPADNVGNQTSDIPFNIEDATKNHATSAGVYIQDEWRLTPALTLNYGARFDQFAANFDSENQLSPRANLVWKIDDKTTAHAGYARYFDPPPIQNVGTSTINKFSDTTNAPANLTADPPRVERSNYFDLGISRQITPPWVVNLDSYYKRAHNLVDLGQFGDAVILSPYNYRHATVQGAEISSTYKEGPVSLFGNFAWVTTLAHDIDSQEFTFAPDELAFIQAHNIKLDHESEFTASGGISYNVTKNDLVYTDILYGSGLRSGFANLQREPGYYPINMGYEHDFHIDDLKKDVVKFRFDVINVFDQTYQLRNGTGLGVNAPQYGQRRTFLVGLAYQF